MANTQKSRDLARYRSEPSHASREPDQAWRCGAFVRFAPWFSRRAAHFEASNKILAFCGSAAIIGVAVLMTFGCATTHATLVFTAPSTVAAGSPFTVNVTVMVGQNRDTIINSWIHFTSSDAAGSVPADYYFTAADAGSHTWTNGFTLTTPGLQSISADIIDAKGISGSANVAVSP